MVIRPVTFKVSGALQTDDCFSGLGYLCLLTGYKAIKSPQEPVKYELYL